METKECINHNDLWVVNKNAILSAIAYFDVFNFPLKINEFFEVSNFKGSKQQFEAAITEEISANTIKKEGDYFLPNYTSSKNIRLRSENEEYAKKIKSKVLFYSNIIAKFPYVECVSISGSYSKGVTDKNGDVDYFIICTPQRLWICRTLLILFKKIFLLNSRKYFCVNYFIDSDHLLVPDKNIFVATEVKFLIPINNLELFQKFQKANNWTNDYLPNKNHHTILWAEEKKIPKLKLVFEKIFNRKFGDTLDGFFLKMTLNKWKKKFPEMTIENFDLNMRTRKNVSKHHPQGFQNKVLQEMEKNKNKIYQTIGGL